MELALNPSVLRPTPTLCIDEDIWRLSYSCYLIVSSYRLLKACVCLRAHVTFLSPPHGRSSAEDCFACSSRHLSAKRETLRRFILSAPQTNRIHIFFWTLDKGISGILEFFLRLRWRSLLTLPSCTQPFLDEPSRSWFQFLCTFWSYSLVDLLQWCLCIWINFMYLINFYLFLWTVGMM